MAQNTLRFEERKKKPRFVLQMRKAVISNYFVFAEHGFVQHYGTGWKGDLALRYHIFVIPECFDLENAVGLEHGTSF